MSLKSTKEQLEKLLDDKDNKVIALSGKWGTGKSHMWDEIKKSSNDENVKTALYASLFGLSSLEQIKTKLLQSAVSSNKDNPLFWKSAKQMYSTGVKTLEGFHKSFGALNDISLLFAPALLQSKIIVLDDIERKHDKLNIDELLGFIDEYKQQHKSRWILILNNDQLNQPTIWNTFREKVIDQELQLRTSAGEAFEIAIGLNSSKYSKQIAKAVESCGVTNIRIICKIIKAVNHILHGRNDMSDAVLSRIIPSTVLLSAIHYKGLDDGPTVEFVLSKGVTQDFSHFLTEREKKESEKAPESQRISRWQILMSKLGIAVSDNFELVVVEYLESGMFDDSEVAKIIDHYIAEADAMNAREACHTFFDHFRWHHRLTQEQLLEEAKQIVTKAPLLDASTVTLLHKLVNELPGGSNVADTAITNWIDAFKAKDHNDMTFRGFYDHSLHHSIIEAFKETEGNMKNITTALDACVYVAERNGWGERQKIALNSTSVQSMEVMIRTLEPDNLRRFMFGMIDMCQHEESYKNDFGTGIDNFIQACKNIFDDTNSTRLCDLIKVLFTDAGLSHLIEINNQPQA